MNKISIITATFNRAHIIRDCLESVLLQNYKGYEYIIVDGASKDNTVEILKEYESKFKGRMRWISEPDKGLYDAINKGIKMATGDVVGIINSDDYFHRSDTFEIVARAFEESGVDAIYADERVVNNNDRTLYYDRGNYFRTWMYRIGLMPGHASFYAKKSLFEQYGYYKTDYRITADYELMMRFAYINHVQMKYIPEDLLSFRVGGVSTQLSQKIRLHREQVRACRENGLFCIQPMIWIKYFFRIILYTKNRRKDV